MFARSYRHKGQALPLALVLLAAAAAMMFFMFNSGQLVQEKIRLTNTADAVAYSAGVFEARVLNYDAYTNRAIIANEIAIGQAVGLASWAKYAGTASSNIGVYASWIPAFGAAMASVQSIVDTVTPFLAGSILVNEAAITGLAGSQLAVHGPGNTIALISRGVVMQQVANKNDPDAVVDPIPLNDDFKDFTQRYTSKDERKRMGQVVHDSRDAFLQNRSWDFGARAFCIGVYVRKRGSTELIDLTDGWKSMDTVSAHVYFWKWNGYWWGGGYWSCNENEVPIGYGKAYSDSGLAEPADYAGSRGTNPIASSIADGTIAVGFPPPTLPLISGAIPSFYDLSESIRADLSKEPLTSLTIRVSKPSSKQRFSGGTSAVKPGGRLALYDGAHVAAESAAVSRVEVYFERPDGNNPWGSREEIGSLFNPYWQVRLAPVSSGAKALAMSRTSSVVLP